VLLCEEVNYHIVRLASLDFSTNNKIEESRE